MTLLEKSFADALTPEDRLRLAALFLEGQIENDVSDRRNYLAYKSYCSFLLLGQMEQRTTPRDLTYDMLVRVVGISRRERSLTPPEIHHKLPNTMQQQLFPEQFKAVIESALRCSLMLDSPKRGSNSVLRLENGTSIDQVISSIFPRTTEKLDRKDSRIPFNFTVAYMVHVCKLEIKWTSALQDHLRLSRSMENSRNVKTLHLFIHLPALMMMLETRSSLIPTSVLAEAIGTMQLLFPPKNEETEKYIRSLPPLQAEFLDPNLYTDADYVEKILEFAQLDHFRERMLELKEDVFDNPPFTWLRFFIELRDPEKFLNFWMALVAIFVLTLISTITGIIQTWKAFHT